jgi:pimeloyl-ACP methyl ester carboxylesterase
LAKRHQVIIPALRGDQNPLGSRRPADIYELAEDLGLTIEALGLERPLLFGVSFGGAVALEYAVENPGRLGGLTLYGAAANFPSNLGSTIARRVLERFPLPSDNRFVNQFFNILHGGKPQPGPLADFIVERCWETDQSVMAHRLGLLEDFDVSDRLWRVEVPTLVIAGSRDVVTPAYRQRELARSIAGARFESIADGGHVGFLTHRREVAQLVTRFSARVHRTYC